MSEVNQVVFKLPTTVTITNCDDLYGQLINIAKDADDIVIDGSEVDKIDTAGVQLVCSFVRTYIDKEYKFDSIKMSEAFKQMTVNLGLSG